MISGDHLILRPLTAEDAPMVFQLFSDPETMSVDGGVIMRHIQEAYQFIHFFQNLHGTKIRLAITDRHTRQFYGTAGFHNIDRIHDKAEIGGELDKHFWGKKIGSESGHLLLDYGFNKLGFHRIEARVIPENHRALALVEHLNFDYEGCLRESEKWQESYVDLLMFSKLNKYSNN